MDRQPDTFFFEDLQFYGAMSAAVSHEIKNAISVINENAGLLKDLILMADKGIPLKPDKLISIADAIARQVKRADDLTRHMNRFAHSADAYSDTAHLGELTENLCAVGKRFAQLKGIRFERDFPGEPLQVQTSPFHLKHLLWRYLRCALISCGTDAIRIAGDMDDGRPRITIAPFCVTPGDQAEPFVDSESEKVLLKKTNTAVQLDNENKRLIIYFNKTP